MKNSLRTFSGLAVALALVVTSGAAQGRMPAAASNSVTCRITKSSVATVVWRFTPFSAPCEVTLRSNGLVSVTVVGANPAVADYTLRVTPVDNPATPVPPPNQTQEFRGVASPPEPSFRIPPIGVPQIAVLSDRGVPDTDTVKDKREAYRVRTATALHSALEFVSSIPDQIADRGIAMENVCRGIASVDSSTRLDPDNYWTVAQNAASLKHLLELAFQKVIPPVDGSSVREAKSCASSLRTSPSWGSFLSRGASSATHAFAESRGRLRNLIARAEPLRDSLLAFEVSPRYWTSVEQASVLLYRNSLVNALNEVVATAQRSLDNDFTAENLEQVSQVLRDADRIANLIANSDTIVSLEANVDAVRGRSRNVVLEWKPRPDVPTVQPGARTVLLDRFRGVMLSVTGGAGFAGTQLYEVTQSAAFTQTGTLIPDSMDLVRERRLAWRPALSTGLSVNYISRSGFLTGIGMEFAVLSDTEGGATTRIVAPVIHVGRDDIRLFFGSLLGGRDVFALPNGVQRLRVARTDTIPSNLIVHKSRSWPTDFYLGIVVGSRSLTPSAGR